MSCFYTQWIPSLWFYLCFALKNASTLMRDRLSSLGYYFVCLTGSSLFQTSKFNSPPFKSNLPLLFLLSKLNTKCLNHFNLEFSQIDKPQAVTVIIAAIATQIHNIAQHEAEIIVTASTKTQKNVFAIGATRTKQAEAWLVSVPVLIPRDRWERKELSKEEESEVKQWEAR